MLFSFSNRETKISAHTPFPLVASQQNKTSANYSDYNINFPFITHWLW